MTWRERHKELFKEIQYDVIKHIAPDEIKNDITIDTSYGQRIERRPALARFIKDRLNAIFSDSYWPKLPRRKTVTCPVTGEQTDHVFGLSRRAWELIKHGVAWEKERQRQLEGTQEYCFPKNWGSGLTDEYSHVRVGLHEYRTMEEDRFPIYDLAEVCLRMFSAKWRTVRVSTKNTLESFEAIWLPIDPYDFQKLNYNREIIIASLTREQAEWMRAVVTQIQWNLDYRVREATRKGSNLLLTLAEGGTEAIEKFNAVREDAE